MFTLLIDLPFVLFVWCGLVLCLVWFWLLFGLGSCCVWCIYFDCLFRLCVVLCWITFVACINSVFFGFVLVVLVCLFGFGVFHGCVGWLIVLFVLFERVFDLHLVLCCLFWFDLFGFKLFTLCWCVLLLVVVLYCVCCCLFWFDLFGFNWLLYSWLFYFVVCFDCWFI